MYNICNVLRMTGRWGPGAVMEVRWKGQQRLSVITADEGTSHIRNVRTAEMRREHERFRMSGMLN